TVVNLSVVVGMGKLSPGIAILMVSLSLLIFLAQHWLLGQARARHWYALSPLSAAARLLPTIAALALAVSLLTHGIGELLRASGKWDFPDPPVHGWGWQLLPAINISILLVLVTAVDFAAQAFRRLREREVAQWKAEA